MRLLGHRGAKGEAPENTMKAIRYALNLGLTAIEIDVHLSKDNQVVVIHDDTVDRTTNGKGKVKDLSYPELAELDAGAGEKVALLSEVLELIKNTSKKIFLMIEIKALDLERPVAQLIEKYNLIDQVAVISFNHRILLTLKSINPKLKTACLFVGLPIDPVAIVKSAKADGLSICAGTVDAKLIGECQQAGLMTAVWVVDDVCQASQFSEFKVDFLATDYPSRLIGTVLS